MVNGSVSESVNFTIQRTVTDFRETLLFLVTDKTNTHTDSHKREKVVTQGSWVVP